MICVAFCGQIILWLIASQPDTDSSQRNVPRIYEIAQYGFVHIGKKYQNEDPAGELLEAGTTGRPISYRFSDLKPANSSEILDMLKKRKCRLCGLERTRTFTAA
jgi:hypothetical protein